MAIYLVNKEGTAVHGVMSATVTGWRFLSWTQNGGSRKTHPTIAAATPRHLRGCTQLVEGASPMAALNSLTEAA